MMTLELAVRLAEILLGVAIFQQSLEFMRGLQPEKTLGLMRAFLAIVLMLGFQPFLVETVLVVTSVILIKRFHGPYNGGSDTMTILVLLCIWLSHLVPAGYWQEIALGYLAIQVILSYFQSGWVKFVSADWRTGRALQNVFLFTAYPISNNLRLWAQRPQLLLWISWVVIIFELVFPLMLFNQTLLLITLGIGALFHVSNALLFGLNRFVLAWFSAYPILIWLQNRLFN